MFITTVFELEQQGVPYRSISQFLINKKLFIKAETFSQRSRQVAIEICQTILESGLLCLLVEDRDHLTIWRERPCSQCPLNLLTIDRIPVRQVFPKDSRFNRQSA